jgi:hypothetical protein
MHASFLYARTVQLYKAKCLIQWDKTHNDVPLISTEMVCCVEFVLAFFSKYSKDADVYIQHTPKIHVRNSNHISISEILKVNTRVSLSTGISPTTERIAPVKYWNKPEKCENPCHVYDIKSG